MMHGLGKETQYHVENHRSRKGTFPRQKLLIIFLTLHKTICCGYSLEVPHRGASNEYPQHMFPWKITVFDLITALCAYVFQNYWEHSVVVKYTIKGTFKKKSEKDVFDDYANFCLIVLKKGICCGYSFELHRQVDAIQMSTHNICLYKKVDKKYTGCNLKTTELLDCALKGVCAVIRSNMV